MANSDQSPKNPADILQNMKGVQDKLKEKKEIERLEDEREKQEKINILLQERESLNQEIRGLEEQEAEASVCVTEADKIKQREEELAPEFEDGYTELKGMLDGIQESLKAKKLRLSEVEEDPELKEYLTVKAENEKEEERKKEDERVGTEEEENNIKRTMEIAQELDEALSDTVSKMRDVYYKKLNGVEVGWGDNDMRTWVLKKNEYGISEEERKKTKEVDNSIGEINREIENLTWFDKIKGKGKRLEAQKEEKENEKKLIFAETNEKKRVIREEIREGLEEMERMREILYQQFEEMFNKIKGLGLKKKGSELSEDELFNKLQSCFVLAKDEFGKEHGPMRGVRPIKAKFFWDSDWVYNNEEVMSSIFGEDNEVDILRRIKEKNLSTKLEKLDTEK